MSNVEWHHRRRMAAEQSLVFASLASALCLYSSPGYTNQSSSACDGVTDGTALETDRLFPALKECHAGLGTGTSDACVAGYKLIKQAVCLLELNERESAFYVPEYEQNPIISSPNARCVAKRELIGLADRISRLLGEVVPKETEQPHPIETRKPRPYEQVADELHTICHELARRLAEFYAFSKAEMSVVLRGGLSLGSYQSGFLFYISEYLKARHEAFYEQVVRPRKGFATVTGASAGGINSLVTTMEGCQKPNLYPEQSLFFHGWTRVGMVGRHGRRGFVLKSFRAETPLGILSKRPLADASNMALRRAHDSSHFCANESEDSEVCKHFGDTCAPTDLGITVTRLVPEPVTLHSKQVTQGLEEILKANKQAERMLFRVSFAKQLRQVQLGDPVLEIHPLRPKIPFGTDHPEDDPRSALSSFYLIPGEGYASVEALETSTLEVDEIVPVLQATSAFPIAFPPQALNYTRVSLDGKSLLPPEAALFVDGGIFDNTPLGLAISMDKWRDQSAAEAAYERGGRDRNPAKSAWLDPHERACLMERETRLERLLCDALAITPRDYLFIEPTVVDWEANSKGESGGGEARDPQKMGLLQTLMNFVDSFLGTSMGASLLETAEKNPFVLRQTFDTIQPRLLVPERSVALTSRRMGNFMGFFEEDFRVYDFYVGLLEAENFFREDPIYGAFGVFPKFKTSRYECMRDYFYTIANVVDGRIGSHDLPDSCNTLEDKETADALAGVRDWHGLREKIIDRMDEDWNKTVTDQVQLKRMVAADRRLSDENFRALIVAMHNYKSWLLSKNHEPSKEFAKFFEVLDEANFQFVDMQRLRTFKSIGISADKARIIVRDVMQKGITQLMRAQPDCNAKIQVRLLGGVLADIYEPRPSFAHISLGLNFSGIEHYGGWYLDPHRWFRVDIGGRLYKLEKRTYSDSSGRKQTFFGSDAALFARFMTQVPFLNFKIARFDLGVGFIASELFAWKDKDRHVVFRYGPEFTLSLTLLRHLYVDAQFDVFIDGCGDTIAQLPDNCVMNREAYDVGTVRFIRGDWRFSLGVGWRWML